MTIRTAYTQARRIDSIWNPTFISVCLIGVMLNLGKQMSNSIIAKYVDSLGVASVMVGVVSSTFALAALLFKLISGPVIDTYNKKYVLFGAMLILTAAFTGYSLSTSIQSVLLFRFVQGAGQAFTASCLLTLASDALPVEKFSTGLGFFALAESVAQAIGPAIGLHLVAMVGYRITFAVSATMMFIAALMVLAYRMPFTRTKKFSIHLDGIVAKESMLFSVLLLIFNFAFCVVNTFLVVYASRQGLGANIGYYFTLYACTLLVSRPLIGKLTDQYGLVKVLIPALCCFITSFWIISCSSKLWMFLAAAVIGGFGFGACQPAVQALCIKCVPRERRGAASSTCYIAQDVGNLVGPIIAGFLVDTYGYVTMWRVMTIPVVGAILFVILIRRKIQRVELDFAS